MKVEEFLKHNKSIKANKYIYSLFKRILITLIIVLSVLIAIKTNPKYKDIINKNIFKEHFNFSKINKLYNKYILNIKEKTNEIVSSVSSSKMIEYTSSKKEKDGVLLNVGKDYPVKMLESGLISYIGEENGMKIVAVMQSNGIDVVYGNIESKDIKVYDYIEKGKIIGSTINEELYLSFTKESKVLDYKPYIEN